MPEIAPPEVFAKFTREQAEDYDEWDRMPVMLTLYYEDGQLNVGHVVGLSGDAADFPEMIMHAWAKIMADSMDEDPPCGFLIQFEGWGVVEDSHERTAEERAQLREDARARRIHTRDDKIEALSVVCADVRGHMWAAHKVRGEDEISEEHWGPGEPNPQRRTNMGAVMLAIAAGVGMAKWNIVPAFMGGSN